MMKTNTVLINIPRVKTLDVGVSLCGIEVVIAVMTLIASIALSLLVCVLLNKVMASKSFKTNATANMCITALTTIALYLCHGLSVELLQGIFLMFVLLYASWSDITSHTVEDYISVIILALGISGIPTLGIGSMLLGVGIVVLPQIIMALIPSCKPLGGADLKISAALAFLLGWQRGITAFIVGLLLAVIYMSIYNKIKGENKGEEKPFALVPFLSIAAMALFIFA